MKKNKSFKYFILILSILFSFELLSENNKEKIIQWNFYDKNYTNEIQKEKSLKPYKQITLKITELKAKTINDFSVSFFDNSNNNEIIISKKDFSVDNHTYDFEKYLIDGKISFGHDGFSSMDYVKNNFHSELDKIYIKNEILKTTISLNNKNFPVFLHPYLIDDKGNSFVKVYKVKKYFQYLIIINGSDGAGAYESYILVDIYNKLWIFYKDITTGIVYFKPISSQKDPFSKNGEKIYYEVEIK